MTQRHPVQNDATVFVTTNTLHRAPFFGDSAVAREAVDCLYCVQAIHPFYLFGFVIMPDHCHFLLRVPAPQTVSNIIGAFKSGVTIDTRIAPMWQRRFHMIVPHDRLATLRYIHLNPVKAGLVEDPADYPWSSASRKWDVSGLDVL